MPRFCNVEITNMSESINHNGIIEKIDGGTVYVRIIQQSACSGCHAKSMCTASESKEKIIEVPDIIVFAAIVTGTSMQWEETTSGLTGLLLLVPYYCILYFLRDKLKKRFIFTLKKLN